MAIALMLVRHAALLQYPGERRRRNHCNGIACMRQRRLSLHMALCLEINQQRNETCREAKGS